MRKYRWLPRVLVESVLIIFSVLLALMLDEWREDEERKERVAEARAAFAEEIRRNRETLASQSFLPYHTRMLARYTELGALENPTTEDNDRIWQDFPQGVNMVRLRDAVWRSLSGSDLMGHIPPRDVFLLADVYRQQEEIGDFNRAMYAAWREAHAEWAHPAYVKDQIRSTRAYLGDVVSAEQRLLVLYDRALRQLTDADAEDGGGPGPAQAQAQTPARDP